MLWGDKMSRKNILKVACIIIVIVSIIFSLSNTIFALDPDVYEPTIQEATELKEKANIILGVVSVIGTIVSVIVIIIVGIKYMAGSIEEKAEYKKTMITYLVGAALLFGATALPSMLYNIGTTMFEENAETEQIPKPGVRPGNNKPSGQIKIEEK